MKVKQLLGVTRLMRAIIRKELDWNLVEDYCSSYSHEDEEVTFDIVQKIEDYSTECWYNS